MNQDNNSTGAKVVTAFIMGLLIGFGSGAFWQERRISNETTQDANRFISDKKEAADAVIGGKNKRTFSDAEEIRSAGVVEVTAKNAAILVTEQVAGNKAVISQLISSEPVWVAVREELDGGLGNILGAQKVRAGTNANIVVELLRPTSADSKYFIVLYRDAGDPAFNYREDVLVEGVQEAFYAR